MADEWRSCTPPGGGRPYFVNLRTSKTVWSLPVGIPRHSVREFSSEDEDAIPAEKLVEVNDLAASTAAATAGTIESAREGLSSKLASHETVKSSVASMLVEQLMRNALRPGDVESPAYSLGLASLAAACCEDGAARSSVHLPLHPAVARGSCFPGSQDLELAFAWRRRRMATAGFTGSRDGHTSYQYSSARTAAGAGGSRRGSLAHGDSDGSGSGDETDGDNESAGAGATAGDEGSAWFFENVLTQETTWDAPVAAKVAASLVAGAAGDGGAVADAEADALCSLPPGRELAALADPLPSLMKPDARAKIAAAAATGGASAALLTALSVIGIFPLSEAAAAALSAAEACADVLSVAADPSCTDDDRSRLATALCSAVSLGDDGSDATPLHAALLRLHAIMTATLQLGVDASAPDGGDASAAAAGDASSCDFGLARSLLPPRVRKRVRVLLLSHKHGSSGGADRTTLASGDAVWAALFSGPASGGSATGTVSASPTGAVTAPGWALVQLLTRVARSPSIPPPTALVACQCLCALATAVDARVLDHWIFPAPSRARSASDAAVAAKASVAGAGAAAAAAGPQALGAVIHAAVRGLVACLTGPAAWAQGFASAAAAVFSSKTPATTGAAMAETDSNTVTDKLQAAVAAALQPAATGLRLSAAASWLQILECALQHAADRVVSVAAAVATAPGTPASSSAGSGDSCIAAVQEGCIPWAALTAVLLACIGAEEASAAAATAAVSAEGIASGRAAFGAGGPAHAASASSSAPVVRSRSSSSITASAASAAMSASPLLTPVTQCLAALHRLFEVAVYSGAGEAIAATASSTSAASGSSGGAAGEARAALEALPDTFGLVTPIVEEAAAATVARHRNGGADASCAAGSGALAGGHSGADSPSASAGAARLDGSGALVLPTAVRGALASALVSVLAAPPADAERRRRSRRLSRSRPVAARHGAVATAASAESGGAGSRSGPVLLDAVFLPLQAPVDSSDAAAASPAFSSSNGQWRGQRLAAASLLCALLECPSAEPTTLLYASDATCLVDVVLAELRDLPPGDHARAAWLRLLKSVLLRSQWGVPSELAAGLGRYRLPDIATALSGLGSHSAVLSNGVPESVRQVASLTLEAAADVLL